MGLLMIFAGFLRLPVDYFDERVSTHDGPGNVHHFLQPPSILCIHVNESNDDTPSKYALYCIPVEVQWRFWRHTVPPQSAQEVGVELTSRLHQMLNPGQIFRDIHA